MDNDNFGVLSTVLSTEVPGSNHRRVGMESITLNTLSANMNSGARTLVGHMIGPNRLA